MVKHANLTLSTCHGSAPAARPSWRTSPLTRGSSGEPLHLISQSHRAKLINLLYNLFRGLIFRFLAGAPVHSAPRRRGRRSACLAPMGRAPRTCRVTFRLKQQPNLLSLTLDKNVYPRHLWLNAAGLCPRPRGPGNGTHPQVGPGRPASRLRFYMHHYPTHFYHTQSCRAETPGPTCPVTPDGRCQLRPITTLAVSQKPRGPRLPCRHNAPDLQMPPRGEVSPQGLRAHPREVRPDPRQAGSVPIPRGEPTTRRSVQPIPI